MNNNSNDESYKLEKSVEFITKMEGNNIDELHSRVQ